MTAVAAHEKPLVWPRQCQRAQVSGHVAWSVDEIEGPVAEEVVCPLERAKRRPAVFLEAKLRILGMLDWGRRKWRLGKCRPSRSVSSLAARSTKKPCVRKLGAVSNMVEVQMAKNNV